MKEIKHTEEVVNYCIDNKVSFAKGYVAIIDNKLDTLDKELADLRKSAEFMIEDAHFKR